MRSVIIALAAFAVLAALLLGGCASVSATARTSSNGSRSGRPTLDLSKLTEREKWNLARETYARALKEQEQKNAEAAVYNYEVTLDLLGSLDLASIEIPTQRALAFQRKVLKSYDEFLAALDQLPASAGPEAVFEASSLEGEEPSEELLEETAEDRTDTLAAIVPNAPPLPGVPTEMNGRVADQINFFMNKGRNVMLRWMERSALFFPRLRPILREEGIPDEVMFLAMIESGLNPRAYSYAHAAGVWQFIPSTGRLYGLQVNSVYDERMHVEASTRAACRYLRTLHDMFGDWYLAFAAYNCGELRIQREIKRGGTHDYWKMNRLPRQTRGYVPAYLAARAICENPQQYGFPELPREIPFECERITVEGAYRLEHVAEAAGHDAQLIKDLNPEYVRGVTRKDHSNLVRLPRMPGENFDQRLANMPETIVKPTTTHRVRKGETLGRIAQKYGTTVAAIRAQPENRNLKPNKLRIGQRVVIPVPETVSQAAKFTPSSDKKTVVTTPPGNGTDHEIIYTVHRGETLGRIAREIGVSVGEICRQNNIRDANEIHPGQKLRIRVDGGQTLASGGNGSKIHTVQPGDTVWSIAQAYGQDYQRILVWNKLSKRSRIYPGQQLIVDKN